MTKQSMSALEMIPWKTLSAPLRAVLVALAMLAAQIMVGRHSVRAAVPQRQAQVNGHVLVHFALSHGTSGAASWSAPFRMVRASGQEFSGCAIETNEVLHSTELVVHVWPRTTSEFLTRDFKLTVSLTSSGAVSSFPTRPTVALGFRGNLYTVVNSSSASKAIVRQGGRSGTFDIRNVFDSSRSKGGLRVVGSWSCTGMMHFKA